ncbi:MAG: hypothetical protein WAU68_12750 [Vitreimonas sp.]
MPGAEKKKPKSAARKRAAQARLADALAGAAWAEADAALADALAEFTALSAAKTAAQRKDAMFLLGQALQRAARKRGLGPAAPVPAARRRK